MNSLSVLTSGELAQLDTALSALDAALLVLLDRGVVTDSDGTSDDDGVDLPELAEAVGQELERRMMEDAVYKVASAFHRGEVVPVLRPDGQVGYMAAG